MNLLVKRIQKINLRISRKRIKWMWEKEGAEEVKYIKRIKKKTIELKELHPSILINHVAIIDEQHIAFLTLKNTHLI